MKNIFIECKDLISVKNLYIKLVKENHPDLGGNLELMQSINAEYDLIKEKGLEGYYYYVGLSGQTLNSDKINMDFDSEAFISIVKFCMNTGLIVELCGSWLWISGDTKEQKDHLKELGCKWSANKAMWYYTEAPYRRRGSKFTMDEIRATHGSKKLRYGVDNLLAA